MYGHNPTMPFGKHKGRQLCDIPTDYLRWVLENVDTLTPSLRKSIETEVYGECSYDAGYRAGYFDALERQGTPDLSDKVNRWYRDASTRFHPDRGGDVRLMSAINDLKDSLISSLGQST